MEVQELALKDVVPFQCKADKTFPGGGGYCKRNGL